MTQVLSVRCKLVTTPQVQQEIDCTLRQFAHACNETLQVAKRDKCYNNTQLHHLVYKPLRASTGLKANHVCQAIRRVLGACKAHKHVHKFRPTSISLDARTFLYNAEAQAVGITLIAKRYWFSLRLGERQAELLVGQHPTSATMSKARDGSYYINIVVEVETLPTEKMPKVIGVDLGRRDIATTSTGKAWNGRHLQAVRDRYSKVRTNVQRKRSRSSRRLLGRLTGRERRFQSWLNHNISRQLVDEAKRDSAALAFEDLTGIRQSLNEKPRNKTERRRTNNWAFYQLRLFTGYKAAMGSVPVVFVPPAYTSQTCSRCHHVHPDSKKSYRNGKQFKCGHCGLEHDADLNAAKNIAALGLSVSQPEIPGIACQLEGQLTLLPVGGEIWDKAPATTRRV